MFRSGQRRPPLPTIVPIRVRLEERGRVDVTIYDADGAPIRTLLERDLAPGIHDLTWDGKSAEGADVSRGVYTYRVLVDGEAIEERPLWIP